MTAALVVFTDGRHDCLDRTLASFDEMVTGPITRRMIVNDSPSPLDQDHLDDKYGDRYTIHHAPARRGFGGTIAYAWRHVPDAVRFVFSTEDDFLFKRPVDLTSMMHVLDSRPHVAQLALRRQAWNADERAAGGVIELNPTAYVEHSSQDGAWLQHRLFWTTNPSLFRRELCDTGWPETEHSEGVFTHRLIEDTELRFGYWGARDSGEWVEHIGLERVGQGY